MRKKPASRTKVKQTSAQRLDLLEDLVSLLLQASLRGRLLPSERKPIKDYLQSRKKEKRQEKKKTAKFRCPACRNELPGPRVKRCPWCSVLLPPADRGSRSKR